MIDPSLLLMLENAVAEEGSQAAVAKKIHYSAAAVSQALSGKYAGDLASLLAKVEEVYGSRLVSCPVLGEIAITRCAIQRRTPFSASNPVRVRLFKACRACANNR